jgi:hypothetical protein
MESSGFAKNKKKKIKNKILQNKIERMEKKTRGVCGRLFRSGIMFLRKNFI